MNFSELNLSNPILKSIEKLGYQSCTPIQEQAIPPLIEGKDVAGLAQTGTGKTAAFLIPLIDRVLRSLTISQSLAAGINTDSSQPIDVAEEQLNKLRAFPDWKSFHKVLILVPTRELVEQVYENFNQLAGETSLKACTIYGGTSYDKQKEALRNGTTFIIATPGRLLDLYKENLIDFKHVRAVVFDEADRMFDMGFKDDMKYILQRIPQDRQFLVFSATLNFEVLNTAYEFGSSPVEINMSKDQTKSENVEDSIFHLGQEEKSSYLLSLLKIHKPKQVIIFSNYKNQIEPLVQFLRKNNIPALGLSSLITQNQRNRVIQQFKEENPNADENSIQVLVATDVAARGLDIQGVDLVINYEMPQDPESYVHRIGRTGRAGAKGKALSFVGDKDVDSLVRIEEFLKHKLNVSWLDEENIIKDFAPYKQFSQYEDAGHFSGKPREHRGKGVHHDKPFRTRTTASNAAPKNSSADNNKGGYVKPERYKKDYSKTEFHGKADPNHTKRSSTPHGNKSNYQGKKPYRDRESSENFQHKNYKKSNRQHQHQSSTYYRKPVVHKVNWWGKVKKFVQSLFKNR